MTNGLDCNDAAAGVHPGATEVCGDGHDNDCAGNDEVACPAASPDADGDGVTVAEGDCNDGNASIHTGAAEVCGNSVDEDCSGLADACPSPDNDGDTYTVAEGDCDDNNAAVHPGASEVCDNGRDDDCVGGDVVCSWSEDVDGDTFSESDGDCNDLDGSIYPAAEEVCDGVDNDCDGAVDEGLVLHTWNRDADRDGYGVAVGAVQDCRQPVGYVQESTNLDCDDSNVAVHPGAPEQCNFHDDNCNGVADEGVATRQWALDADGDGFGIESDMIESCASLPGRVASDHPKFDCNDADAYINPGRAFFNEDCCDTVDGSGCVDQNCDGNINVCPNPGSNDRDGDDYTTSNGDCNDRNPTVHPGDVRDLCGNGVDENCSEGDAVCEPSDNDNDNDGVTVAEGDCNDHNMSVHPGAGEVSGDTIDQNCNGSLAN